jgi:RNA polymerase sigma-70 factor (ECF subfamily)
MDTDAVFLERWRAGDRDAGEELFRRHFRSIYRFFESKAGSETDDLVQRTFLACLKSSKPFRGTTTLLWYLLRIARHELYAFFRRRRDQPIDFGITSLAEIATTAGSRLARAQEIGHLKAALERLPADQYLLLEMHYWDELDAAALAEVFETVPGTIRVRLLRARKALRAEMARVEREAGPTRPGTDALSRSLEAPDPPDEPSAEDEG